MAGLVVYNNTGVAQIDSEHRNIRLLAKGSVQANSYLRGRPGGGSLWFAGVPTGASRPMFAFASSAQVRCVYVDQDGVPTMAFHVINQQGANIDWWQFDVGTTALYGSGIRIFNAAGQQVFDGGDKVPKVMGFTQTLGGTVDTGAARLAVCMSVGASQIAGGLESNVYVSTGGGSCSAALLVDRATGTGTTRFASPCQLLLLDVADL